MGKRVLSLVITVAILMSGFISSVSADTYADITSDLKLYYNFNGSSNEAWKDITTITGNAVPALYDNRVYQGASMSTDISMSGMGNALYLPVVTPENAQNGSFLQPPENLSCNLFEQSFTISFWFKAQTTMQWQTPMTFVHLGNIGRLCFTFDADNKLIFNYDDNTEPSGPVGKIAMSNNISANDGQWHLYTVTASRPAGINNDTLKYYVDGVLKDTNSTELPIYSQLSGPSILNRIGKGLYDDSYAAGLIDDIRIYSRDLSSTDVDTLYLERDKDYGDSNLVLYHNFNGTGNDAWRDITGIAGDAIPALYDNRVYEGATMSTATGKSGFGNALVLPSVTPEQAPNASFLQPAENISNRFFNGSFTISFWFKANSTTQWQTPVAFVSLGNVARLVFAFNSTNNLIFHYDDNMDPEGPIGKIAMSNNVTANDGQWHLYTITADRTSGDDTIKYYVDGTLKDTDITELPVYPGSGPNILNRIGKGLWDDSHAYGLLDELKLYQTALTSQQVMENFTAVSENTEEVISKSDFSKTITAASTGLYNIVLNKSYKWETKSIWGNLKWDIDNQYSVPFTVCKENIDGNTLLGTMYLTQGSHTLTIQTSSNNGVVPIYIAEGSYSIVSTDVYMYPRFQLSTNFLKKTYNGDPRFNAWVEAVGWEDVWTCGQYLNEKFIYTRLSGNTELKTYGKNALDNFIINKMIMTDGAVHTVYKPIQDVYEVSIEPDMKQNVWEMFRGNCAAIEQLLIGYKEYNDINYLNKAIQCGNYILNSWPTIYVSGLGDLYTRTTEGIDFSTEHTGMLVMVMSQLYKITNDAKWVNAAIQQAKLLLRAQGVSGLYSHLIYTNGVPSGWEHGNAFSFAVLGLSWLYHVSGNTVYRDSILNAVAAVNNIWDDNLGSWPAGDDPLNGMPVYLAGRVSRALFSCAYFLNDITTYRLAEKHLYWVYGRNRDNRDLQESYDGGYRYTLVAGDGSNTETTPEVNLASIYYYYYKTYWPN